MRTTLDLDERVLAAARARARAHGITIGQAVSQMAARGLDEEVQGAEVSEGFPTLPNVPGHVITEEMVASALDEDAAGR